MYTKELNLCLKFLLLSFPILIVIGPFALNSFSIIFSIYAIFNFKLIKKNNFFSNKIYILFFSFIVLIFPYENINFNISFQKYLSFLRYILMMLGIMMFLMENNEKERFFIIIQKTYIFFLVLITIDVLIEYIYGSNIFGYNSNYNGRIASFTNDELIIGYIYCFLALFTFFFIYKNTNNYFFFLIMISIILISFIIGERSNFIKLSFLIVFFIFINFIFFKKVKLKNIIFFISLIILFFLSLYHFTKNTPQGNKLFYVDDLIISKKDKIVFNIKGRFYQSNHAAHYITAYKIFLNYPIAGIGINNFHAESKKKKYEDKSISKTNQRASTHPHQLYLEILSETGVLGFLYFVFIFFYPIYISLKKLSTSLDMNLTSTLFLHFYFIFPILPSGSIFGTVIGIPFWFNLAFLFYFSKRNIKTNC
jgi:O-antigen ligase